MRRLLLWTLVILAVMVVATIGYGLWIDPEGGPIDETVRAGAPGRFVELSNGVTHYDVAGPDSARVVVLIHGFSVPYYIWDPTADALAESDYRVVRYDLYGRGLSDRPDVAYTGAFYDAQLIGLLDALRVDGPVDVAGVSFGGVIAAHFVSNHPDRAHSLTLVDPAAGRTVPSMTTRMPVIGPWLFQTLTLPGMADRQMIDFLHPENYPTWVAQYRPQMRYEGFGRALHSTIVHALNVDLSMLYRKAGATGVPVLVVWGKQDRTVPFSLSSTVLDAIPQAEFVPVDSSGHLPHIEQASRFNALFLDFLNRHRPTGP